jgi:hypothetical protein
MGGDWLTGRTIKGPYSSASVQPPPALCFHANGGVRRTPCPGPIPAGPNS